MRAREVEEILQRYTGWTVYWTDRVTRSLRACGMLPVGGRGLSAPDVSAEDAAKILLGGAGADLPHEAAQAVMRYAALPPLAPGNTVAHHDSLLEAVAFILADPRVGLQIAALRICRGWGEAVIDLIGPGGTIEPVTYCHPPGDARAPRRFPVRTEVIFPSHILQQLALDLEEDDGGWEEPPPEAAS